MKRIVVLSGAGVSAESGIKTFRDAGGLWEGYDVMTVASPQGWTDDPELVLDFYNQRRAQLHNVQPNAAHKIIASLESRYDVEVITQNVDDLHERGGSSKVLHLHGELRKVRSVLNESLVYHWEDDVKLGDKAEDGGQLRPHIVWFGEAVPMMEEAVYKIASADHVIIIGTSMQVYPAAGLISYAPNGAAVYYVDPKPQLNYELNIQRNLKIVAKTATEGMKDVEAML